MRNARSAPANWSNRVRPGGLRRRLHGKPALPRRRARAAASRPGGHLRPGRQSRRAGALLRGLGQARADRHRRLERRRRARERPRPCSRTGLAAWRVMARGTSWADWRRIDGVRANANEGGAAREERRGAPAASSRRKFDLMGNQIVFLELFQGAILRFAVICRRGHHRAQSAETLLA